MIAGESATVALVTTLELGVVADPVVDGLSALELVSFRVSSPLDVLVPFSIAMSSNLEVAASSLSSLSAARNRR